MQFALFRRFIEWNWGRRMPFKRRGQLLPEKIEGMNQDDAAKIKAASGLPVICVGGWQTASRIREALSAGHCDVVSIARGLLANPDMVHRFAEGQNAPARPCTYCNKCARQCPAAPARMLGGGALRQPRADVRRSVPRV